jgi:hypothetical protein
MKDQKTNKNTGKPSFTMESGLAAVPTRPQKPKDGFGFGGGTFTPGKYPIGGFQAVWNFSGRDKDYKNSPTTKPDKKVY